MSEPRAEAEVRIDAPAERVWEAWADPSRLASWFVDEARGRIGEADHLTWIWEEFGLEVEYDVAEVEPGRRFVLQARGPDGIRATETVLVAEDGGTTRVRVMESGFGAADPEAVGSGWKMALAALRVYVEDYWDRPSRSVLVMAPTSSDPDTILSMYKSASGLSSWLGSGGPLPEEGGDVALSHPSGLEVTGPVLRRTGTEVSLRWREVEGVLELKQFPGPDGRMVALRAYTWAPAESVDLDALRRSLAAALGRLTTALG